MSFVNNGHDTYINHFMFNPLIFFHYWLPLKLKFLPETYILKENHKIKGLITAAPTKGRQKRVEIKQLLFEENSYNVAEDLVQYVVSKYKAMGAFSVIARVDDYLTALLNTFISKCGFSQISYEKLWKTDNSVLKAYNRKNYRPFRNSDSQAIANIYNDSLLPHIRPLLSKEALEYKDKIFSGLSYYSEYKYSIIDTKTRNIVGCIFIYTSDNLNYIIDIVMSAWSDIDFFEILGFAQEKIKNRNKNAQIYVKTKRYINCGSEIENKLLEKGVECVQNQSVLTNSSAKVLENTELSGKFTIVKDFLPSNITLPTGI